MLKLKRFKVLASLPISIMLAIVASLYVGWQLWGLRFTNHDDIFFHLAAMIFSNDYLGFANSVAQKHGRLAAFINMPIVLTLDGLAKSYFYDILNIGSFLSIYFCLAWLLSRVGPLYAALSLISITLLLFPLHYYFTFPQGFPVMGAWEVCFIFLAESFLFDYLKSKSVYKFILSNFLFFCSLWGAEYNIILHPILILTPVFKTNLRQLYKFVDAKEYFYFLAKIYFPYIISLVIFIFAYETYSFSNSNLSTEKVERLKPSFDFLSWLYTFFVLEKKAFLPLGLWNGITLANSDIIGMPSVPSILDYKSITEKVPEKTSIIILFVFSWLISTLALQLLRLRQSAIVTYTYILLSISTVPCAVLSVSTLYQNGVRGGWIQGHLVTFYAQLGIAGLLVVVLSSLCNLASTRFVRVVIIQLATSILAGISTITFVYNNINRQVMSANYQKWVAMDTITQYIKVNKPDISNHIIYAPDFWKYSGVSSIPNEDELNSYFNKDNYWIQYAKTALKVNLPIKNLDFQKNQHALYATYSPTFSGDPIVVLYEENSLPQGGNLILVNRHPFEGSMYYYKNNGRLVHSNLIGWECQSVCSMQWNNIEPFQISSITFIPSEKKRNDMLSQFFLDRHGSYGMPLLSSNDLTVIDWGPKTAKLGFLTHMQPNGDFGIWVKFQSTLYNREDLKVFLDGEPSVSVGGDKDLLTALFSLDHFNMAGKKELIIRSLSTGEVLLVGIITVDDTK